MSVNDTDEWASMIINELFDKTEAAENITKRTSGYDEEAEAKNKITDIPHFVKDLSMYESVNSIPDFENHSDIKLEAFGDPSDSHGKIPGKFNKRDNDSATKLSNNQDMFTNAENITSDCNSKSSVEIIEVCDTELVSDNSEKNIDDGLKNDVSIIEVETTNLKDDVLLIDLDEAFIHNEEMDLTKDESEKDLDISFSSDNVNDYRSKNSNDQSSLDSTQDSCCEEKINTDSVKIKDEMSMKSYESINLDDNSNVSEVLDGDDSVLNPMQGKTEFETCPMLSVIESVSRSSQEYLDRIGEKVQRIGFQNLRRENCKNVDRKYEQSNLHSDLHYKWFEESYIKNEIEYRRGSTDGFIGNEYLTADSKTAEDEFNCSEAGENLKENPNNLLRKRRVDKKSEFKKKPLSEENVKYADLTDESFERVLDIEKSSSKKNEIYEQHKEENFCVKVEPEEIRTFRPEDATNKYRKRKCNVLEYSYENMDENFIDTEHRWLHGTNSGKTKGINGFSFEFGAHQNNMHTKNRIWKTNPKKSIFTECETSTRRSNTSEDEINFEEVQIKNQRVNFVVSKYRNMCATFETVFVRPFANVLADSYEFLSFLFFLVICVLCYFYTRIHFIMSNYRLFNFQRFLNSCRKDADDTIVSEKPLSITASNDDAGTLIEEITTIEKVSPTKAEVLEQLNEKDSWVKVELEDIVVTSLNFELVTENIRNLYETSASSLSNICGREQHRATIKTDEHSMNDVQLISIHADKEKETLFDMEIVASSKELRCDIGDTDIKQEADNSQYIEQNLEHYEENSIVDSVIEVNSNDSLDEIFRSNLCGDVKPLLNSTEVDAFDRELILKCQSCSNCKKLPDSNMDDTKDDLEMKVSPVLSLRRKYFNSSLSVNVSSLFSRLDDFSDDTIPLLADNPYNDESVESAEDFKISPDIQLNKCLIFPPTIDEVCVSGNSQSLSEDDKEENVKDVHKKYADSIFDENLMIPNVGSWGFDVSSIVDTHFQSNDVPVNSFMADDAQFTSNLTNPNEDLLTKHETGTDEAKSNSKRKNCGLRRRMSTIFNNWRNMPSCIVKNPAKNKKNSTRIFLQKGK